MSHRHKRDQRQWKERKDQWQREWLDKHGSKHEWSNHDLARQNWSKQEWQQQKQAWREQRRSSWGLRRRLTLMFAAVALAAVVLTTWLTLGAVFNLQRDLFQADSSVISTESTSENTKDPSWTHDGNSYWNSPEFAAGRRAFGQVTRTAFVAALIAFFLASGAAGFVTRLLTKPLLALTDGVKRYGAGERGLRLEVPRSRDEFQTLTEAFNSLVEGLERQETWRRNMVADIAHDLRTPLSVMRSEIEGMQDGVVKLDEAGLERLHGEVMMLSRLVDDLRTLSLAESGGLPIKVQSVDLNAFLHRLCDAFKTRASDVNVELELTSPALTATFDPDGMMRVLSNLLDNALRYASPGVVEFGAIKETGGIKLWVRDHGIGLPKEALEQVFERFYRADSSRTNRREGSGLGLAIAKAIVEAHGGTIEAANHSQGGAVFTIHLPDPTAKA
jgi:two-component system, OmpR family, sensor histidine kinase BaeS